MDKFCLPQSLARLVEARNSVREHYRAIMDKQGCDVALKFTLDGNLVGDIGEALAVELFGIKLVDNATMAGIDGFTASGKTVQVKATGTGRGPAFRQTETQADYLLFFDLNFETSCGVVVFNGPEHYATSYLPREFTGQRMITAKRIREADRHVKPEERLRRIDIA